MVLGHIKLSYLGNCSKRPARHYTHSYLQRVEGLSIDLTIFNYEHIATVEKEKSLKS